MRWIRVLTTAPSKDVNLPSSVRHRSVPGHTIIVTPGKSMELTDEEWSHIETAHPDVAACCVELDR